MYIYISQYHIDNVCVCDKRKSETWIGEESSSCNQKNIIENDIDLTLSWKHPIALYCYFTRSVLTIKCPIDIKANEVVWKPRSED